MHQAVNWLSSITVDGEPVELSTHAKPCTEAIIRHRMRPANVVAMASDYA